MLSLTIDNRQIQVPDGTTILEAAQRLGIHIPTLCFADGYKPTTSCMVCVVQVEGLNSLVPACGTQAADKMVVTTDSDEIQQARKTAVELLLSEHVGDCVGPCERGCPADMNIPLMIRQIAAGQFAEAVRTVKKDIPLPAVLGRICSAPCEKVCRRKQADAAVAICLLKRFVADIDLQSENPYRPDCHPDTGKKVAVIGAGPCGLSAAYYLKQAGIKCTLFDEYEYPGGSLRYGDIDPDVLPPKVVEKEIKQILNLGIEFQGKTHVDSTDRLAGFDAVLLAVGKLPTDATEVFEIRTKDGKIQVTRPEYETSRNNFFAVGACIGSKNLLIRVVADGKNAARAIESRLLNRQMPQRTYNHQMGRLETEEMEVFLDQASGRGRLEPENETVGMTPEQAQAESRRCLHCDCRKRDNCKLRELATDLTGRRNIWPIQRKLFEQITNHEKILFEPGKCIKCGLCVQTAQKAGEQVGLSFEGRGFDMRIAVPLKMSLGMGLQKVAAEYVNVCPTGALSFNQESVNSIKMQENEDD